MKNLNKSEKGFTSIEIALVIVVLAIIGLAGYFVAKHVDKAKTSTTVSTKSVSNPTESTKTSTTTPTTSNTSTLILFKIPELGIEFNIPNSLSDLTYSANTTPASNGSGGTLISAILSTKSLAQIDPACADTASYGGFNTIVVSQGKFVPEPDVTLVKQFSNENVYLSHNQEACSQNQTAINAENADQTALQGTIDTLQLIN